MANRRDAHRRFLGHETLEQRSLLAGLVGDELCSPFQNPVDASDLNADGNVTAADALVAINSLNAGVVGDLAAFAPPDLHGVVQEAVSDFVDATGDGKLTAADALDVINRINSRLPGGPIANLPTTDVHADWDDADSAPIITAGEAIGQIDVSRGFAKVLAALNGPDSDVFQIEATKSNLSVSLFSVNRVPLTVTLYVVNETSGSENNVEEVDSVSTEDGSRRPARLHADLTAVPGAYYLVVTRTVAEGSAAPAATETAAYALGVLNYNAGQFRPVTDSELGDDQHSEENPTDLPLEHRHARVRSNIDSAADVDSFSIANVQTGTLLVTARADFPIEITVEPLADSLLSGSGRRIGVGVTAGTTYVVSVKSADGSTGPYRLEIVNLPPSRIIPPGGQSAADVLFTRLDDDNSGALSKEEVKPGVPLAKIPVLDQIFNNWDSDQDGQLNFTEFDDGFENLHDRAVVEHPVRDFINRVRRR